MPLGAVGLALECQGSETTQGPGSRKQGKKRRGKWDKLIIGLEDVGECSRPRGSITLGNLGGSRTEIRGHLSMTPGLHRLESASGAH